VEKDTMSLRNLPAIFAAADLVTEGAGVAPVDPLDGTSLAGMLHGDSTSRDDTTRIEFLGEGVYAPACIVLRDGFK
jgi:hypothetical protein